MLRTTSCVTGLITRLRINRSTLQHTRHSSLQQDTAISDEAIARKILNDWPGPYRVDINTVIREIGDDITYTESAKLRHIDERSWLGYLSIFRRKLVKFPFEALNNPSGLVTLCNKLNVVAKEMNSSPETATLSPCFTACKQYLFNIMIEHAQIELKDTIESHKTLLDTSDMRLPHEWYPYARLIKRKIIFHGGPTNSGKTYQALQRLKNADPEKGGGLYCGPLRLLALEVFDSLNRQGVYTDLSTGQEKRQVDFATHIACTVEMVQLDKEYDVAVVDEIQMIANDQRGFAWTRVLLGLRAREIHVCGGLEACEIVRNLVACAGDDFELVKYDRLSTLNVSDVSLRGDYSKIQPGDCVVAFSKADIFSIRRQIERLTPYKCAMIYGQLPPETRSTQARLFNEDNTGYDVLVASDAIGMGLNLNIKRIVFHTTARKEGSLSANWCDPSSVKQIAGRAGRLSSNYKVGEVTAWQDADLAYIRGVMSWDIPQIKAAGIFPSVELIDLFSQQLKKNDEAATVSAATEQYAEDREKSKEGIEGYGDFNSEGESPHLEATDTVNEEVASAVQKAAPVVREVSSKYHNSVTKSDSLRLSLLVERFVESSKLDGRYYLCDHANLVLVSNWLHSIPLTLSERFVFANAPVDVRSAMSMSLLYQFAATYAMRKPVALNVRLPRQKPRDVTELSDLCLKHNALDLYLWLSIRFPEFFVEQESCLEQKAFAIECIQDSLESPHLQHKFSHSSDYQAVRVKMLNGKDNGLPPESYGEVRDAYVKNMASIDQKNLYVFPTLQEENGGPSDEPYSTNRYRSNDPLAPKKYRKDDDSRSNRDLPSGLKPPLPVVPVVRPKTAGILYVRRAPNDASNSKPHPKFNPITKMYEIPKPDYNRAKMVEISKILPGAAAAFSKLQSNSRNHPHKTSSSNSSSKRKDDNSTRRGQPLPPGDKKPNSASTAGANRSPYVPDNREASRPVRGSWNGVGATSVKNDKISSDYSRPYPSNPVDKVSNGIAGSESTGEIIYKVPREILR